MTETVQKQNLTIREILTSLPFDYSRGLCHCFKIKTDHGVELEVLVSLDGIPTELLIDGYDLPAEADALHGVMVSIGGKVFTLANVVRLAQSNWQDLPSEDMDHSEDAAEFRNA
jgi:hypothetical protein